MQRGIWILSWVISCTGLLYPQRNEFRGLDSLDGLWTFVYEPPLAKDLGISNKWFQRDLSKFKNATKIPVPAAFNELLTDRSLRNYAGWVWYQTIYYRRATDVSKRLVLRFGSVNYWSIVYINGQQLGQHVGGHLPFEIELPSNSIEYVITVAVNTILSINTIPSGDYGIGHSGNITYAYQRPNFDFFNYAGILRPVTIQVFDKVYLKSLKITTEKPNILKYQLAVDNTFKLPIIVYLALYSPDGRKLQQIKWPANFSPVEDVQLWWPRGYGDANLYKLQVTVASKGNILDSYTETFGFRSVEFKDHQVFVNEKLFYCIGFGMHEEYELGGRGYNPVGMIKDLNLFEWFNANCYRTSHYPYSEERAYEADRRGIMVITETPGVGLRNFNDKMLTLHKQMVHEMISRDQNHPSVFAWSLANEPTHGSPGAGSYFKKLAEFTRTLDNRPIGLVYGASDKLHDVQKTAESYDFIGLNHYDGWYRNLDILEVIETSVYTAISESHKLYPDKVIFVTEYGAEGLPGYSHEQSVVFTEQYQHDVLKDNFKALDRLRNESVIAGEMVWTFADFMTAPDLGRPYGNHKGVLTRQRHPKQSAYLVKRRYKKIIKELRDL